MPSIGPEHWQIFAGLAAILILLGGVVVALKRLGLLRSQGTEVDKAAGGYSVLSGRLDRHEERLRAVEGAVSGLASRDDIHKLQLATESCSGEIRKLYALMERDRATVERLDTAIQRIESHLLGEGRP
ncbi:MAG: hypothetical protein GDA47_00265 [Rhodospirillales bacterium]|nr:hypothetical protein [Rhodospirillales bacterium]